MTQLFLFSGIGLAIVYFILLLMNKGGWGFGAFFLYGYIFSFVVFIYLSTRKILWAIIAIPLIYLAQIILQLISGAVIRAILKKP